MQLLYHTPCQVACPAQIMQGRGTALYPSMQQGCSSQMCQSAFSACNQVPSGEVWAGSPARLLRQLEPEEAGFIAQAAADYAALAAVHAAENAKTTDEIQVWARSSAAPGEACSMQARPCMPLISCCTPHTAGEVERWSWQCGGVQLLWGMRVAHSAAATLACNERCSISSVPEALCMLSTVPDEPGASPLLQLDNARREDRAHRSLDYDSHLGLERDPITREILHTATHT